MIGKTISHYKITEKLGEGGMGVVYKAEDTQLKRFVALKFLPRNLTQEEDANERFIREAQAASALDHPNICTIYSIEQTDDAETFICMAHYDGESLKDKIKRRSLPIEEAIDIASQIANGLARAHEAGIIHRDIKPGNIIITVRGETKILDFGLAKLAGQSITKSGSTLGTVAYMSPEIIQGGTVDERTDIWALGVVLYELLTGEFPFKGEYEPAIQYAILHHEPEPITGLRPGVPMELERIVNKSLTKNPQKRYQHVDEMAVDLKSIRKQIETGKTKTSPAATESLKRKPVYQYVGLAVLLALVVLAGIYLFPEQRNPINSIAVLPLDNLSGDSEQEYFADGMTDALITDLAKIGGLRVISRSSVMRYKGTNKPVPQIAQELGADYVVDGSVLKIGNQIKIIARLIDAPKDEYIWAEDYEQAFSNIFALQAEIAQTIAGQILVKLTPQEEARFASVQPSQP